MGNSMSERVFDLDSVRYVVNLPDFKDSLKVRYSDLFGKVEYIVLEAPCEDAVVGGISRMELTNNNEIIIFDRTNNIIVRYDSCGTFLNKIGECGHGPNEYIRVNDIAYDSFTNQIIVSDESGKLLFFNLNGKLEKNIKMPFVQNFTVLDYDHLLIYMNYSLNNQGYNYLITTKDGELCSFFERFGDISMSEFPPAEYSLQNNVEGGILGRSYYSSIVYLIQSDKTVPYLELLPPDNHWSLGRPDNASQPYDNRYRAEIRCLYLVDNKLFMDGYDYEGQYGFFYYDDLKGVSLGGKQIVNDMSGSVNYVCPVHCKKNKIYFNVDPEDFSSLVDSWKTRTDIPEKDIEFATQMSQSINPIIQVCTVKD